MTIPFSISKCSSSLYRNVISGQEAILPCLPFFPHSVVEKILNTQQQEKCNNAHS